MSKQIDLNIYLGRNGGRRPNSGRKAKHSPGVRHRKREAISRRDLLHINFKYKTYIRSEQFYTIFKCAIKNSTKYKFRILEYSIESNHVHLIAEAENTEELCRGMRSLTTTLAIRLNQLKNHSGKTQIERYHLHVLKSLREARNALVYVLCNHEKHVGHQKVSKFSSLYGMLELPEGKSWIYKKCKLDLLHL